MPKAYEAMRDKFAAEGMDYDDAQTKAAKIYNAKRKPGQAPVSGREAQRKRQARKGKKKGAQGPHKPNPNRKLKGGDPIHGYTYED